MWFVSVPEEPVKDFASLDQNLNKTQSINLSPNQCVYEEDPYMCQTSNILLTFPKYFLIL